MWVVDFLFFCGLLIFCLFVYFVFICFCWGGGGCAVFWEGGSGAKGGGATQQWLLQLLLMFPGDDCNEWHFVPRQSWTF